MDGVGVSPNTMALLRGGRGQKCREKSSEAERNLGVNYIMDNQLKERKVA